MTRLTDHKTFGWAVAAGAVAVLIVAGALWLPSSDCRDFSEGTVQVNERTTIAVAVADSNVEQARGLAGCTGLPKESGMYFPYDELTRLAFWMKGMVIPIDIVWIADGEVVGINAHVPPPGGTLSDQLPRYQSPRPVNGVLEVGDGEAARLGITVGSHVTFIPGAR